MGGRCAEKIIFNDTTTGASNDIAVATDIAKNMVTQWGMSDNIGPLHFKSGSDDVFLGREISYGRDFSDQLSSAIDTEVSSFVRKAEENAIEILNKHIACLHNIAKVLLDRETISGEEMKEIIETGKIEKGLPEDLDVSDKRKRRSES